MPNLKNPSTKHFSIEQGKERKTFLAVDPGITGTGIALFQNGKLGFHEIFSYPPKFNWQQRSDFIVEDFSKRITLLHNCSIVCNMYIEAPQFFESDKGIVAARDESLMKLIFHFGRLHQVARSAGFNVYHVPIPAWKGQLTKNQVENRIFKTLNQRITSHAADAVGIGLYVIGQF